MLSRLSARSPLLLRVFLTGVSALAVIVTASAFSAPGARSAAPAGRPETAAAALIPGQGAAAAAHLAHLSHEAHLSHLAHLAYLAQLAAQAKRAAAHPAKPETYTYTAEKTYTSPVGSGVLTAAQVGQLWLEAGGPAWAESRAEEIAHCESGWRTDAENPDGASGLWQILGSVVPGDLFDPLVNARNAVAKFTASGDTFAQWTCR